MATTELKSEDLYTPCDTDQLGFETTEGVEVSERIIGQPRAVEAVGFGIDIRQDGYNLFALGPAGTGKRSLIRQYLDQRAPDEAAPNDWCYVNNFEQEHKPLAVSLPAGKGRQFRDDMNQLVEEIRGALGQAFESEEYQQQQNKLQEQFARQQSEKLEQLQEKARQKGLALLRTPQGIVFAPMDETGEPMSPDKAQKLPEDKREQFEADAKELQKQMQELMEQAPREQREARRQLKELNRRFAEQAVGSLIQEVRDKYGDHEAVATYLDALREDLLNHAEEILKLQQARESQGQDQQQKARLAMISPSDAEEALLRRYRVNLLVGNDPEDGAPVVYENNPTYQNLIGRIEHRAEMGTLQADFHLIKCGALHRANGGYLILEAIKLFMHPYAWDGLKRCLQSGQVRVESLGKSYGLISTETLEPAMVDLGVKVVLLGSRQLFGLLQQLDPEFTELFKVPADFAVDMDRAGNEPTYAQLIATLAQKDELHPFDKGAIARVIEHSSRLAGDAQKLSIHMRSVADLLQEADYWAGDSGNAAVTVDDVQKAIDAKQRRCDRMRERIDEEIQRGTIQIATDGQRVGQVNGLSVFPFADVLFGRPNRITARVRMGGGEVVDIEREVALGGPIHAKGVLILSGFLSGRYASDMPLSLSASVVFEQSYSGIEGDSASAAELCALLSAVANLPLRQSLAVTGSVNQHGDLQAIGGANEKIEGFFDICRRRGLTGEQGVLIPESNVQHLMLRSDVREAVDNKEFHVWSVATIDEAVELLTGVSAGEPDAQGNFTEDSVNGKVAARLRAMAEQRREYGVPDRRAPEN